jgi:hypothetical protein
MKETSNSPLPRDNVKTVEQAIEKIRFEKTEILYVFKNDKQILRFQGTHNQINIPTDYLFHLNGSIVIHNHPANTSFSFEDVEMAIFHRISKLIVSTPDFIYEIKNNGRPLPIDFGDSNTLKIFHSCEKIARSELEKLLSQNQISNTEVELKLFHYIWILFFATFDIQYGQKRHPN